MASAKDMSLAEGGRETGARRLVAVREECKAEEGTKGRTKADSCLSFRCGMKGSPLRERTPDWREEGVSEGEGRELGEEREGEGEGEDGEEEEEDKGDGER